MKYILKTLGSLCHYQFSDIQEKEVRDIESGEMDYHELEESFLLNKCSLENQKISIDDEVKFEIFDGSNSKVLQFYSTGLEQNDKGSRSGVVVDSDGILSGGILTISTYLVGSQSQSGSQR